MNDINCNELKSGCIIDIHQTVNGRNLFYVKNISPLEIYYDYDRSRRYEYNEEELIAPYRFNGEPSFEIVTYEEI